MQVNDKVKVNVSKYRVQGVIIEINGDEATVKVPVYYGQQDSITVVSKLKDLEPVFVTLKEIEDYKRKQNKK
jgi:RNA polymerase-interacting CarD/CdnL/TRCF family regulator